ncbi:MAG: serine/threonine-protein kinase [Polyangiaceae bacterium]
MAAGGMGAVYEAEHLETGRRRALKVMHAHLFESDEMRDRFKREARIASRVESEHIVDVSDAGVDDATKMPFIVMELLRGDELGDLLEKVKRLPPEQVITYLSQAATALDRTHASNIIHRDLKPENLFLTHREDGTPRIKILDFGVAKIVAEGATVAGVTRSLGTPLYMAPEQFRSDSRLTPAADIHALGMMAYTLLVGVPYWDQEAHTAGDVIAFAMTVVRGPQERATVRAARAGVSLPPAFDGWFAKVTAMNPVERFRTASETIRALGAALGASAQEPSSAVTPDRLYSQRNSGHSDPSRQPQAARTEPMASSVDTAVPRPVSPPASVAKAAFVLVGAIVAAVALGVGVYVLRGSLGGQAAAASSESASPVVSTPEAPSARLSDGAELSLQLGVAPDGVSVEVDGRAVAVENGTVLILGLPGSSHQVILRKDGRTSSKTVVLSNAGLDPARLEMEPPPTPVLPIARGTMARTEAAPLAGSAPPAKTAKPGPTAPPTGTATVTATKTPESGMVRTF